MQVLVLVEFLVAHDEGRHVLVARGRPLEFLERDEGAGDILGLDEGNGELVPQVVRDVLRDVFVLETDIEVDERLVVLVRLAVDEP